MMRKWIVVAALAWVGCKSGELKSDALKLSWKPPRSVTLVEERPDALLFSSGVQIHSIAGEPPPIDEGKLDALLSTILSAAKLEPLEKRISARVGSIPAGPVARYVLAGGGQRSLYYYLPLQGRFLLISLSAAEAGFGAQESQLDLSLSSLKIE
jgi:hypothetical protein